MSIRLLMEIRPGGPPCSAMLRNPAAETQEWCGWLTRKVCCEPVYRSKDHLSPRADRALLYCIMRNESYNVLNHTVYRVEAHVLRSLVVRFTSQTEDPEKGRSPRGVLSLTSTKVRLSMLQPRSKQNISRTLFNIILMKST